MELDCGLGGFKPIKNFFTNPETGCFPKREKTGAGLIAKKSIAIPTETVYF
jgi:hypothetical protein